MAIAYDATIRAEDAIRARATTWPQILPDMEHARLVWLEGLGPRRDHDTVWEHRLTVVAGAVEPTDGKYELADLLPSLPPLP
jgi:hypothetical protein